MPKTYLDVAPSPYRGDLIDVELIIETDGEGICVIGTNPDWRLAMVDVMESAIKALKQSLKKTKV
jgi:hypothetical protein